jgi:hypothetical protein
MSSIKIIPDKKCACGCGEFVPKRIYEIKYIQGHHLKGAHVNLGRKNPFSKSHIENLKKSASKSEKRPLWKGTTASLNSIHRWVKLRKPKPSFCEDCGKNKPKDLANISGEYKRDIDDYEWLCRKCHMSKDGRLKIFMNYAFNPDKRNLQNRSI